MANRFTEEYRSWIEILPLGDGFNMVVLEHKYGGVFNKSRGADCL